MRSKINIKASKKLYKEAKKEDKIFLRNFYCYIFNTKNKIEKNSLNNILKPDFLKKILWKKI